MIRNRQPTGQDRSAPRDDGTTFIELLVTIVLTGTIVLGVLAATQASVRASRVSREASRVESALLTAAERIERASRDDADYECPLPVDLSGPVYAAAQLKLGVSSGDAPMYASVGYEHLSGGVWQPGPCPPPSESQQNLVQRITITMTSPNNGLTRTMEVLKGDA